MRDEELNRVVNAYVERVLFVTDVLRYLDLFGGPLGRRYGYGELMFCADVHDPKSAGWRDRTLQWMGFKRVHVRDGDRRNAYVWDEDHGGPPPFVDRSGTYGLERSAPSSVRPDGPTRFASTEYEHDAEWYRAQRPWRPFVRVFDQPPRREHRPLNDDPGPRVKGSRRRVTIDPERLRESYARHDGVIRTVAEEFGVSYRVARNRLVDLGIRERGRSGRPATVMDPERLRESYARHGSIKTVAEELGLHRSTVRARLIRLGIHVPETRTLTPP